MDDLDIFLEKLRTDFSGRTNNNRLRARLHWENARYHKIQRCARDRGYIVIGPGGGGGGVQLTPLGSDYSTFTEILCMRFDSRRASNITLRRELDWDDARYWATRGHALEYGKVTRSRGKGGIVQLVDPNEGIENDLERFIEILKETFSGHAGNRQLRDELRWEPERYASVRQVALDRNRIVLGRGRGGSVRILQQEHGEARQPERELYPPALETIQTEWVRQGTYDDSLAIITAHLGSARTGGTWSRPDITVLTVKGYKFPPAQVFEIITFEIKPQDRVSVVGVFEALAHRQFANRSYVLYHVPAQAESTLEDFQEGNRILDAARKFGVGIILAGDVGDWDTWNTVLESEYKTLDPEHADSFISACLGEDDQKAITEWFR